MTTIVFAHPWHGSFGKAILDTIIAKYKKENKAYSVIDLNKDEFNPVITEKELSLYSTGESLDPLVSKYQKIISKSDEIIFIFPIWWHTMPAILKGFFDKVLLLNFAFNYENGWTPLLKMNKTSIITTSDSPTERFRSSIEGEMKQNTLAAVGIDNAEWYNCDQVSKNKANREKFLEMIIETV